MLEPGYFEDKADKMIEMYRELEDYIMDDIAKRLLKSGEVSGTADRLIWKLEQMGQHRTVILNKIAKMTNMSRRELKELLQNAVLTSWEDDLSTFNEMGVEITSPLKNPYVVSIMDAEWKKSQGELENLTRSAMLRSQRDLIQMMDEAELRIATGVKSYSAEVCDILDRYAGKGAMIDYPTGTQRTLEAAVRMCVVTSMNQTSAQVTNQYIVESGAEYVLVSAHIGARIQGKGQPYLAGHDNWQGKIYRIQGSEPGYPNLLEKTGYEIEPVTGTGHVRDPRGLHGYGCRHGHKPWDKRLRNPYADENGKLKIDTEENRKMYKLKQTQRAYERAIRKTKRQLLVKKKEIDMIAETDVKQILQEDYDRLAYQLRQQNKKYNEFCEEHKFTKEMDRIKVSGFRKEQASIANGRATKYENKLNSKE